MRALVAVTCFAVLAAIGYFFWGEYQAALTAQKYRDAVSAVRSLQEANREMEATNARDREEIFTLADADAENEMRASNWCWGIDFKLKKDQLQHKENAGRLVENCRRLGLLD